MPFTAGPVPDQAGDLGLMHREDHRRRRAGAAERVAHLGNVGDRRAVAAEPLRDLDAQKPLLARRVDGGLREARVAVDLLGLRRCSGCDARRPLREGTAVDKEWLVGLFRDGFAEPGFLHVHGRFASRVWRVRNTCVSIAQGRIDRLTASDNTEAKDLIQMRRSDSG